MWATTLTADMMAILMQAEDLTMDPPLLDGLMEVNMKKITKFEEEMKTNTLATNNEDSVINALAAY